MSSRISRRKTNKRFRGLRRARYAAQAAGTGMVRQIAIPKGIPKAMTVKLFYHQVNSLDPAAGLSARQVFRMNGCYDPDLTGGGHQPLYFDQLMAMYTNAYVVKFKMTVRPVAPGTPADFIGGYMALITSPNGTETLPDYDAFLENVKTQGLPYKTVGSFLQNAWNREEDSITLTRSLPKMFKISKKAYVGNLDYANTQGSYPTDQFFAELVYMNMAANNAAACYFDTTIEYTITFTEPYIQASS